MITLLGSVQSTGLAGAYDGAGEAVGDEAGSPGVSGDGAAVLVCATARMPMEATAQPPAVTAIRRSVRRELMTVSCRCGALSYGPVMNTVAETESVTASSTSGSET